MKNINSLLNISRNYLKKNNILSASLDSELLLSKILNKSREYLIINFEKKIDRKEIYEFKKLIKRRKAREPIAYILEKKDFWKSTFYINKSVLIPRPDTEILIQEILKIFSQNQKLLVLDIGTGSGCILLSLLKERKNFKGVGIDVSKNALKVAQINAKIHHLENRVKFINSSVDNFLKGKYDLIVSNPPYIKQLDLKNLERDVFDYEPSLALKGGIDGLTEIRRVIKKSSKLLKKGGKLVLEIGYDQMYQSKQVLRKQRFYINKIAKDYSNNYRCIVCTKI